jgi:hypothetical protein
MKRTNIVVEQWQYDYLRDRAAREKKSLSAVVRDLVRVAALPTGSRRGHDPVLSIIGIGRGLGSTRHHDDILYRRRPR